MHQTPQNATTGTVSITDAVGTTPVINYRGYRKGFVYVPNGSSLTGLTWYASDSEDGDYEACHDGSSAITSTVAADRAVPLPTTLEGAAYLKAVGNAAGNVKFSFIS